MKTKDFTFTRNNKKYTITTEITDSKQIVVPYYKKLNNQILGISFYPDLDTFIEDMKTLLPESIGNDFFEFIKKGLFVTIDKHLSKFGRITEPDLDLYICETILIIEAIVKENEGTILSYDEKYQFFEGLKTRFSI